MWQEKNDQLSRDFSFDSYVQTFGFVSQVALLAQEMNHHPTITFGYNQVHVILTTHDEGGVTDKDRALAQEIEDILSS